MQIFRSVSSCVCKIIELMGSVLGGITIVITLGTLLIPHLKQVVSEHRFVEISSLKPFGTMISRRCLGCCTKPSFVTTNNNPTGKPQDTNNNRPSILEDFCSSSTYDMDNSLSQFQITTSSTTNLLPDTQSTSSTNPSEFINHGFLLWNQTRQQWIGDKAPEKNKKPREPVISWAIRWNATYDNLLGTNKPFTKPIPLPEMVNFLVDIWEQEGLYD